MATAAFPRPSQELPLNRYILRYTEPGDLPAADLDRIHAHPAVKVVRSTPRMLLVEAPEASMAGLTGELPGWVSSPERTVPLPDTRKKILTAPE